MLTRENKISLAFAGVAVLLGIAVDVFTSLGDAAVIGIVLVVGMVLPRLALRFL